MRTARRHPTWIPPAEWLGSRAAARTFRCILITNQPATRLHSQMDPGPVSRRRRLRGASRSGSIRPMRRGAGSRDGDVVRVFNDRGACLAGAVARCRVMPGVAVMATGAWFDPARRGRRAGAARQSQRAHARHRHVAPWPRARAPSPRWSRSSAGRAGAGSAGVHAARAGARAEDMRQRRGRGPARRAQAQRRNRCRRPARRVTRGASHRLRSLVPGHTDTESP